MVGSLRMSEQKRALLTGWCNETVNTRLNSLKRVPHAGDWRRSTVVRVQVKTATVTWPYYNKWMLFYYHFLHYYETYLSAKSLFPSVNYLLDHRTLSVLHLSSITRYLWSHFPRNDFQITVVYKRRIKCTKAELLEQFTLAYNGKMNRLVLEFRKSKEAKKPGITQVCRLHVFCFLLIGNILKE